MISSCFWQPSSCRIQTHPVDPSVSNWRHEFGGASLSSDQRKTFGRTAIAAAVGSAGGTLVLGARCLSVAFALIHSPAALTTFRGPVMSNHGVRFPAPGFSVGYSSKSLNSCSGCAFAGSTALAAGHAAPVSRTASAYSTASNRSPSVFRHASRGTALYARPNDA